MKYFAIISVLFGLSQARMIIDQSKTNFNTNIKTPVQQCYNNLTHADVQFFSGNKSVCTETPCKVFSGDEVYMVVNFTTPYYLENIGPELYVNSIGISFPFDFGQPDACDTILNTMCPLVKNEPVTYRPGFLLPNIVPDKMVGNFKMSVIDKDTNNKILCYSLDFLVIA